MSVPIKRAGIKKSAATRVTAGGKIGTAGPKSPFYAQADMKTAIDNVAAGTTDLATKVSAYNDARVAFQKAGTALEVSVEAWDGSFDVLVAIGEKVFVTPDDAASVALDVADRTKNPLAVPVAVDLKQDLKKSLVRIHVERAPGMMSVSTQVSPDPTNPALWKELPGYGANHVVANPTPGNLWARAASRTANALSDYTAPVLLVVK